MNHSTALPIVDEETAIGALVVLLAEGDIKAIGWAGYDVLLEHAVYEHYRRQQLLADLNVDRAKGLLEKPSVPFYSAAWVLCQHGILRPGVRGVGENSGKDGSAGGGFCITPYGRRWLEEHARSQVLPMQPRRFLQMVERFGARFGVGYLTRTREALGCYEAGQRLACCAMCGAAAESILLRLAGERVGDEEALRLYRGRDGRVKTEQTVLRETSNHTQRSFRGYMELLKYWRDEAAHGRPSDISDDEAFTSLMLIARLAQFSNDTFPVVVSE